MLSNSSLVERLGSECWCTIYYSLRELPEYTFMLEPRERHLVLYGEIDAVVEDTVGLRIYQTLMDDQIRVILLSPERPEIPPVDEDWICQLGRGDTITLFTNIVNTPARQTDILE